MKSLNRELLVYEAVKLGLLQIMPDGTIWKVAEMRGNRWNNRQTIRKIPRRRAEHDQGQYFQVRRMTGAKRTYCFAHRLVWIHFNGPIAESVTVNHKNGNKKDNRPTNLELATYSAQMKHAYRTGLKDEHGQKNPNCKVTDAQVEAIRTIYAAGTKNQAQLAQMYGVKFQAISKIVRGDRRKRQSGPQADYTNRRKHDNQPRNSKGQFLSA